MKERTKFFLILCNIVLYWVCISIYKENQYSFSVISTEIWILAILFFLTYDYYQTKHKKSITKAKDLEIQLELKSEYQKIYNSNKAKNLINRINSPLEENKNVAMIPNNIPK